MPKDVFEELHDLVQASLKPPPSRAKWMVPVASSLAGIVVGKKFVFVNDIARRVGENCTITLRHPAPRASGDENWLIVQADTEQAAEDADGHHPHHVDIESEQQKSGHDQPDSKSQ